MNNQNQPITADVTIIATIHDPNNNSTSSTGQSQADSISQGLITPARHNVTSGSDLPVRLSPNIPPNTGPNPNMVPVYGQNSSVSLAPGPNMSNPNFRPAPIQQAALNIHPGTFIPPGQY